MTAVGYPDEWDEFCLVAIQPKGGSDIELQAMTEDITAFEWMKKDINAKPLINGGRVTQRISHDGPESITMKVYPVSANLDGTGVSQLFHPQDTDDTTDPIVVLNTLKRNTYRLVLLWTTELPDGGTLTATTVPSANEAAQRIQIFNAYITDYKPSFDSKMWSAEVTFKWAPFTKAAVRNKIEESTDGTSTLDAVTTFT